MTFKRTIELENPLTEERKFVDVVFERNCSHLLAEEAERHSPDENWCLVGVHPYGYMEPIQLRERIERLERAVTAQAQIIGRLDRVVSQQRSLILKLNMDSHRRRFVTLRRVRTGE